MRCLFKQVIATSKRFLESKYFCNMTRFSSESLKRAHATYDLGHTTLVHAPAYSCLNVKANMFALACVQQRQYCTERRSLSELHARTETRIIFGSNLEVTRQHATEPSIISSAIWVVARNESRKELKRDNSASNGGQLDAVSAVAFQPRT